VHPFRQLPPPFVSPKPPFVACRLSAFGRAATMAGMSTVSAECSPQSYARTGGLLYLLIIAAGLFAEFVRERFVVPGDAAATASNITDQALMFRLGLAADLSTFVCAVALTIILYVLLKPFNRNAALLMLAFNLVPAFIGELSFAVWLTVKGVNMARWPEETERSTAPS
jgi:hypothetical protein